MPISKQVQFYLIPGKRIPERSGFGVQWPLYETTIDEAMPHAMRIARQWGMSWFAILTAAHGFVMCEVKNFAVDKSVQQERVGLGLFCTALHREPDGSMWQEWQAGKIPGIGSVFAERWHVGVDTGSWVLYRDDGTTLNLSNKRYAEQRRDGVYHLLCDAWVPE